MAYELEPIGRVTLTRAASRCHACQQIAKGTQFTRMSGMHVFLCDACFDACESAINADRRPATEPEIKLTETDGGPMADWKFNTSRMDAK